MIAIEDLPHFNATFNAISIAFLSGGLYFIWHGMRERHKFCMVGALVASAAFLVTYLIYHFNAGLAQFGGEGIIRPIYFTILIIHVIGAIIITPLVPITVWRAVRGRFDRHRAIARWTWPLWMFVAVSGVVVYVMTIHLYPYAGGPHA